MRTEVVGVGVGGGVGWWARMDAQINVKRNVQDLQDFVADMQQWKKEVKGRERGQGGARARQAPPPFGHVYLQKAFFCKNKLLLLSRDFEMHKLAHHFLLI